ncbi:hypothetical protein ACHHV8_01065 [Paenibacillus sp. TAB 01]|uniref:hypothetical protein n=1 Tax=Paenibacillus sp. TAB 01 TaxID=3368988 RepID=UPI0037528A12
MIGTVRYIYYFPILWMLVNIMIFVPSILFKERYHGAMASMGTAVVVGSVLELGFLHVMRRFPGQGVPEILATVSPAGCVLRFCPSRQLC